MKTTTLHARVSVSHGVLLFACCLSPRAHAFVVCRCQPKAPTPTRISHAAAAAAAAASDRRSLHASHAARATYSCRYATEPGTELDHGISCDESNCSPPITIERYEYDEWNLTYRYRPATPGHENDEPLILVHPVGIGCSSWIWTKMMEVWKGGAIYAPNLIGCGLEDGNDAWDPDARGLSIPLGWVKAVEALVQERAMAPPRLDTNTGNDADEREILGGFLMAKSPNNLSKGTPPSCTIVVQGGSAPIGVLLASRNPMVVSKLVLTSPPTWEDMTTATPEEDLARNYNFYRSSWGKLAFALLESRWAVRLFSNLFLFLESCDDRWVDFSTSEEATTVEARPPVAIFNSGFLQHRSYEEELSEVIGQPTLIINGSGDKRAEKRIEYGSEMKCCKLVTLRGTNVLPWEAPEKVCEAIQSFAQGTRIRNMN